MPGRPLPDDLAWYRVDASGEDFGTRALRLGGYWGMEVAIVTCRVDGKGWGSTVNRHRESPRPFVLAPSQRLAMRWAERWALARLDLLRAAATERDRVQREGLR